MYEHKVSNPMPRDYRESSVSFLWIQTKEEEKKRTVFDTFIGKKRSLNQNKRDEETTSYFLIAPKDQRKNRLQKRDHFQYTILYKQVFTTQMPRLVALIQF